MTELKEGLQYESRERPVFVMAGDETFEISRLELFEGFISLEIEEINYEDPASALLQEYLDGKIPAKVLRERGKELLND